MRTTGHARGTNAAHISILLGALILAIASSPGCSSKSIEEARKELEEQKNKKKEKPKPPFDRLQITPEPNDKIFVDLEKKEDQIIMRRIKPGHWTGVLATTTANQFDFSGELTAAALDGRQNPIPLERSPFNLVTSRSAALAKGQRKTLEGVFFPPCSELRTQTFIASQLHSRTGGQEYRDQEILQHMPNYQYFLFVLARDASRYRYFNVLDCVRPPADLLTASGDDVPYYRVLAPRPTPPLALPSRALCWTSIAYMVWDDFLPTSLTNQQQQALVDWLHWGGGLIISGPQSLDALRGSFLDPYLPAAAPETTTLDQAAVAEMNAHWSITSLGETTQLKVTQPWSAVKLAKHASAEFLAGSGELVAVRRVGRGRVVASAFKLTERDLLNWRSFDSFVNGALLGRPPRRFDARQEQYEFLATESAPAPDRLDPEAMTAVRFFTRDAKRVATEAEQTAKQKQPTAPAVQFPLNRQRGFVQAPADDPLLDAETASDRMKSSAGAAGWNDFSWAANTARATLREAAGISVPKREFVLWMLVSYLVIIVPVNWLVFRALGRVEWAWIAVPVLAIAWGLMVVWLAQLDIGFARSETEVDVLEVPAGYSRGHLTRYTALYTSLSTSYQVHFDDPAALALPFAAGVELLAGQGVSTVALRNLGDCELDDYAISSNTTGLVHGEQMLNLGGTLDWSCPSGEPGVLANNTKWKISGVSLTRRRFDEDRQVVDEAAWIGDLVPGAKADVEFKNAAEGKRQINRGRELSDLTSKTRPEGSLSLRRLTDIAEDHDGLAPGDVRLIAWREGEMGGMSIVPRAPQARRATLVIGNLQFGSRIPKPDQNTRAESKRDDEPEGTDPKL